MNSKTILFIIDENTKKDFFTKTFFKNLKNKIDCKIDIENTNLDLIIAYQNHKNHDIFRKITKSFRNVCDDDDNTSYSLIKWKKIDDLFSKIGNNLIMFDMCVLTENVTNVLYTTYLSKYTNNMLGNKSINLSENIALVKSIIPNQLILSNIATIIVSLMTFHTVVNTEAKGILLNSNDYGAIIVNRNKL